MKSFLITLLFSGAVFAASGTADLGPTIGGGGGGGGGANVTLSNLTSPTAINQSLLFNPDATLEIGQSTASRPSHIFSSAYVTAGRYPFGGAATGAALVNAAAPGLSIYNGGSDAYAVVAATGGGVSIQNPGAGVDLLNIKNTSFNFMSSSASAGVFYFKGGATGVTVDNTLSYAGRNAANTADIPMLYLDAFNRTNFASGSGQNILLNNNMISVSADTTSLGVVGDAFTSIVSNSITLGSGGGDFGSLAVTGTDPAGNSTNSGIYIKTDDSTKDMFLYTLSGTASKNVWIESGNASAGASGNITLQPGTATGTVGRVVIANNLTGLTVPTTVTAIGTTGSVTINKMSGTVNIAAAASTATVTNSLVTANSIVLCVIRTADATAVLKNCVPGAGSFVVNFTGNATAATSVGFLVIN